MRDLLFLTQRIPYPPTKGDKIRSWHILKYLAKRYRVHLGCFVDDPHDRQFEDVLKSVCATVHCEFLVPRLAKLRSLSALPVGKPLTLSYFASRRLRQWVEDTIRKHPIERAFVFCSAMAPYVADVPGVVRILDMVDVDSQKWMQYAQNSNGLARVIYAREGERLLRFEREMVRLFDHTLLVSPAEVELFNGLAPDCAQRVVSVANGVDCKFFSPADCYPNPLPSDVPTAVFVGAMDYRPNIDAVQWFADRVMPELAYADQELKFWIVGSNPSPAVRRLSSRAGIHVTGRVEDVRPYLAHARAVVAPLQIARGVQNKVLEAMAMGKPVVATPEAKAGITAIEGEEILVASEPSAFSKLLQTAISDAGYAIGLRARCRVEADYSWLQNLSAIGHLFEVRGLAKAAQGRRSAIASKR